MKIKIEHKKITSFPIIDEETLIEDDITQIENSIRYGNNASILVSGYRGSGKTSVINNLKYKITKQEDTDNKYVFIDIDLNKNMEYNIILRRLIRKLYINISDKFESKNKLEVINELELLYNKTFYDISHSVNYKKMLQSSIMIESKIDLKKILIAIGSFLFSATNLNIDRLNIKDLIMTLILALSSAYLSTTINTINKLQKEDTEEFNSKSLYDDDIAQHELETILKKLNEKNIKCIFILDEMDKIEDSKEINKILYELKPFILSNLATFIIVCGQKLHYKYIESEIEDDPVISSLFTSTLHVPLASREQLQDIFKSYINEEKYKSEKDDEEIKKYIDLIIFKSNSVLRQFNNEICKNIVWEDNEAYIYINIESISDEIDIKMVAIIDDIINSSNDVVDVIKDFFVQQLYIWSKKIKYKIKFTTEEILDLESYESKPYLEPYIEEISIWFNRLISYMKDEGILEEVDKDSSISYKLNFKSVVLKEENILIYDDLVNGFIKLINQIFKYGYILCELMNLNTPCRFDEMIIYLEENKIIDRDNFILYNLENISSLYESIVSNSIDEIGNIERVLIKESTHYIEIIRNYIVKKIFLFYTTCIVEQKYNDSIVVKEINSRNWSYNIKYEDKKILFKIFYNDNDLNRVLSFVDRNNKIKKYDKIINIIIDENNLSQEKYLYNADTTESGRVLSYKGKNVKDKEYKEGIYLYYISIASKEDNTKYLLENKYQIILEEVLSSEDKNIEKLAI